METWQLARSPPECVPGEEIPETSGMQQDDGASASAKTQVPRIAIEALPDEILVSILQWLPFNTKICVLPEVCQKWRSIASDFSLFPTTINFRDIPAPSLNKSINYIFCTMKIKKNIRPTKLILPRAHEKVIVQDIDEDFHEKSFGGESFENSSEDSDKVFDVENLKPRKVLPRIHKKVINEDSEEDSVEDSVEDFDENYDEENLRPRKLVLPRVHKKVINEDCVEYSVEDFDENYDVENLGPRKLDLPRVQKKVINEDIDEDSAEDFDEYKTIVNLLETGSNLGVWKSLTKFSAREIDINDDVFSNFISSLNTEIFTELSINWMTPHKMYLICRHLTKLQRFMMWDIVSTESLQHLTNAGRNMKYLRELQFRGYVPVVNNLANVLDSCGEQLELLTLRLHEVNIVSSFMISLGLCRKLTYLHVWLSRAMKYGELRRTLSRLTQLEQLCLDVRGLTSSRASEDSLFQELKYLRHVYLWIEKLQDKDVTDLCINCGHCLETINLFWCSKLTDTAVTSILTSCHKLVALKLKSCVNIDKVKLLEKLTENPENHLPQLILLNLYLYIEEKKIPSYVMSNCLTARPQLFIKTNNSSIDEISASSILFKILGPNCHHRKRLIRELL